MNTIEKLLDKSNSQSLDQWRDHLKQQVSRLDTLFYHNGALTQTLTAGFTEAASLIVMAEQFNTQQLSNLLTLLNLEQVQSVRLYAPQIIESITVMRFTISAKPAYLKASLDAFAKENMMDFALMDNFPDWQKPGLVLMDMDSTTIQIECIDEIARLYGVGEQVSAVTELAMQGKLDFNESLRTRVAKLAGAPISILNDVADSMPLMPGLLDLIKGLKKAGWKVAIASGGFTYFADRLKADHGFDYVIANTLEINEQRLTGQVIGEIVNASVKASTLEKLAAHYNIPMSQTVAIGDGANDLLMLAASALGIAIHAKPIVQENAAVSLNHLDLQGALCLLSASSSKDNW
ncbi:phosphoserine phosphatase SerB [Psychromonas antarctica]|uniref:phosphoserine phosphatase SerB n=1 Tax=Psychromonas antarctica TaxID=67573 RepID=UPI001EE7D29B|nr:phosphoserine phosphatase SerB [Psychromonas antarctica]